MKKAKRLINVWGFLGFVYGLFPLLVLLSRVSFLGDLIKIIISIIWACLVGIFFTYKWSDTLHKLTNEFKKELDESDQVKQDQQNRRNVHILTLLPAWLGIFERVFYCILIGQDITGGAAFIGVWIALKSAGGWQTWSKGEPYGHSLFINGLLGSAMSVWYGIIAGLTIRVILSQ